MFKLINTCVSFDQSKIKCAEVFCHTHEQFSIVCVHCEMKTFDFNDFWLHFKNMHLTENSVTCINERQQSIKVEGVEEDMQAYINPDLIIDNAKAEEEQATEENKNDFSASKTTKQENPLETPYEEQEANFNEEAVKSESEDSYENMTSEEEEDDDDNEEYIPTILKRKSRKSGNDNCCKKCNKIYKSEKMLEAHMIKKHRSHKSENHFKCNYCSETFFESRLLKTHVSQEHRTFPCPHCERVYKSNHLLRLHLYSHSGERRFKCDHENCDKAFFNPKLLSSHKRMVHVLAANFVCEMCGYRTKSNSVLEVHKRSHTGEKPCICKTCGKGFASQSLLSEHQPIHSSERPYGCEVCGASFSRPKALYHHKHLHLGIKKFVCKICGKAYAQAAGLSGHMRHHKAELSLS